MLVKRNGRFSEHGVLVEISDDCNSLERFREILKEDYSVRNVENSRFFTQDGNEITEGTLILTKDNDIIYIEPSPDRGFDFSMLVDQYKVLEKLGQGGFGKVHKAHHRVTKEVVAIKYINITEYCILIEL